LSKKKISRTPDELFTPLKGNEKLLPLKRIATKKTLATRLPGPADIKNGTPFGDAGPIDPAMSATSSVQMGQNMKEIGKSLQPSSARLAYPYLNMVRGWRLPGQWMRL
jgi:hypothetical protein